MVSHNLGMNSFPASPLSSSLLAMCAACANGDTPHLETKKKKVKEKEEEDV